MFQQAQPTSANYFNSYSSLEPDQAVRMNGEGRTLSGGQNYSVLPTHLMISFLHSTAPDIARNNMRAQSANSKNNTLSSAARRRMEDRLFTRSVSSSGIPSLIFSVID